MRTLFGIDEAKTDAQPRTGGVYVRVAVERGIDRAADHAAASAENGAGKRGGAADGGTLTYWTDAPVQVGDRVDVPLGRGNTPASGIVVEVGGEELLGSFSPAKVKAVSSVVGSRLPPSLIELARWMAGYYVCPLGMVLATMMPAAVKHGTGKRRRTLLARATPPAPLEPDSTPDAAPAKLPPLPPSALRALDRITALDAASFPIAAKDLALLVESPTLGPINKLIRAGYLQEVEHEEIAAAPIPGFPIGQTPTLDGLPSRPLPPELTPPQRRIVEGIAATTGRFATHLLRGVTGSGKTEVYLRVMEGVLAKGHSALVLVPEISLTPQTAGRFEARFGSAGVAVLHSGLTPSQRHKQWARVSAGECRVVVGARSAVFAPLVNLGLIVVDEEHDASYKQDQLPRYHGRDVAIMRAHLEGCPIILGSATPSMESWANASPDRIPGRAVMRSTLWELTDRVAGGKLPKVELVGIAEEKRLALDGGQRPGLVGPTLGHALRRTLEEGGQAILLLNRRGFANYICCLDQHCGWALRCDQCDAGMIHHRVNPARAGGFVRCHHCLSEQRLPRTCPLCQGKIGVLGAGTQRVEEELIARFGLVEGETFLRVDSDTMRSARDYFDALSRFGAGEVKVLLGTQMISKGLDYPNVRLVGVIDADTSLNLPDFRSTERTFQLISQVAGRAGRGTYPGRVIVQTMNPENSAVRLAALHDYVTFANEELGVRLRSGLPPASRMARIVVRDEDEAKAESHARLIADELRAAAPAVPGGDRLRIKGPAPCPLSRLANFYRFGIELTADARGTIQSLLAAVRAKGIVKSDTHTAVDVDPLALL